MAPSVAGRRQPGGVALDAPLSRLLLVRHAEAGERREWRGDDRLRPLTAPGRTQARHLAEALAGHHLGAVLTSGYERCLQTVQPIAARRRMVPEVADWLEEGSDPRAALETLLGRGSVLACTHGDVVSGVLFELSDRGVDLGASPRMQKGSTWVLEVEDGRVVAARYLAPPRAS